MAAGEDRELYIIGPIIRQVWCRETASPSCQDGWSKDNLSWGQCAVTALLVQCIEGGELLRTVIEGYGSHYYNRLPSGQTVDLTSDQFPEGTEIPLGTVVDRQYVLDSERAVQARSRQRYDKLKDRFFRLVLATLIGLKSRQG